MILPTTPDDIRAFIDDLNRLRDKLHTAALVPGETKAVEGMAVRGADAALLPLPDDTDDAEFAEALADEAIARFDRKHPKFKGLLEAE
jgi:hypothetical protein